MPGEYVRDPTTGLLTPWTGRNGTPERAKRRMRRDPSTGLMTSWPIDGRPDFKGLYADLNGLETAWGSQFLPTDFVLDWATGYFQFNGSTKNDLSDYSQTYTRADALETVTDQSGAMRGPFGVNTPGWTDRGLQAWSTEQNLVPNGNGSGASGTITPTGWAVDQGYVATISPTENISTPNNRGRPAWQFRINGVTNGLNNRLLIAATQNAAGSRIAVTAGLNYVLSYDVQLVAGSLGVAGINGIQATVMWYDAGGALLSVSNGAINTITNTATRFSDAVVAPASAVTAHLRFDTPGSPPGNGTAVDFTLSFGAVSLKQTALVGGPYIPTTAGAATRNAPLMKVNMTLPVVFAARFNVDAINTGGGARILDFNDGTGSNRILVYYDAASTLTVQIIVGGVAQMVQSLGVNVVPGTDYAIAGRWAAGDFAASVNGAACVTGAPPAVPTTSQMNVGSDSAANASTLLNGNVRAALVSYNSRNNAALQALAASF